MDFFLDDLCPFVREDTIQEKFRLCAKQFAAGKEIYCNQKSEEHILEYTQDFNQLYGKIPYNPLNCLHHTGIRTQNVIQTTFNL